MIHRPTFILGAIALLALGDVAMLSSASARGGGLNIMNSPGYQRRLQESRGYVPNQSGSILSQPSVTAPHPNRERRLRRRR